MFGVLDYTFHAMGSDVRFLIGRPLRPDAPVPLEAADRERGFVFGFAQRLSRFAPDSELSALNRDPRSEVPTSTLLGAAVSAGVWAAAAASAVAIRARWTARLRLRCTTHSRRRHRAARPGPTPAGCGERSR